MKLLVYSFLVLHWGCANYVSSVHRQIDKEESRDRKSHETNDPYQMYRDQGFRKRTADARPIQDPRTVNDTGFKRSSQADILPVVQRNYKPMNYRHSNKDFIDNDNTGSLWASNSAGALYGAESTKRPGDIVIINVLDNLRSQISNELKRAFPDTTKKTTKAGETSGPNPTPAQGGQPSANTNDTDLETKVYDKISGIVAEEISDEYVLVKGKKEVIFRKEKRYIEIQALVSRRDIQDNDTVNSDKVLESRVNVLR